MCQGPIGLNFSKSFVTIFIGVVIASSIMTVITLSGIDIVIIILGVIVTGIVMIIITMKGFSNMSD